MQRIDCSPRPDSSAPPTDERKGSVLILVIALLGMLLLLGIAFYSFAAQEHVSAGYFAETYKERLPGLSAETLFDYGLEQLIVGPAETQKQSALYGRTHSLVGNMLGINANTVSGGFFDPVPYNGQGVNLALNGTNGPIVDQDYDGTDDGTDTDVYNAPASSDLLSAINLSAAANRSPPITGPGTEIDPIMAGRPQPDVGYTYPDINNLFIAHISEPAEDVNGRRVIIPSFHRPQILRDPSGAISATWPEDMGTEGKVLRPHPEHLIAGSTTKRFITSSTPETNVLGNPVNPFPFTVGSGRMGVWTGNSDTEYDFDADNDNDGTNEGIWLDLGFPAQTLIDGRRYVPLFSFTVQDADGLINLNTAGNLNEAAVGGGVYDDASSPDMQNIPISTSHLGASRTEVNPQWALWDWTSGNLTADQQKEFKYFPNLTGSMSRTAIANMELIHIKNGQKRDDGTGGDEYNVGAWGELSALQANGFASPGQIGDDDLDYNSTNNSAAGSANFDPLLRIYNSSINFPSTGTPLDLRGFGSFMSDTMPDGTTPAANGLVAHLTAGNVGDPNRWLTYGRYLGDPTFVVGSDWGTAMNGTLMTQTVLQNSQEDEADESIVEPLLADSNPSIQADEMFGPDEMPGLHLTNSEFTSVAGTSRLRKLAPINFAGEAVRKQFTTTSFDRAEFSWTPSVKRSWEFNADDDADGLREFPPAFLSQLANSPEEPFRDALRNLLRIEVNSNDTLPHAQFRLALNGVLTGYNNSTGRPTYRALTPHNIGQESQARLDRQLLARDIYVLLYSLGGGQDNENYATVFSNIPPLYPMPPYPAQSGTALYSNAQLQEMAQFAVNVVDAMDRDNVITRFEYDVDLSDGWNLDDDAFGTPPEASSVRKEVFGVEAQELTLSEWLAVRVNEAGGMNPDHPVTRRDDTATPVQGDFWAYIELKSVSPYRVDLSNWGWRIRKEGIGGKSMVTLKGSGASSEINPGSTYIIGTTSNPELDTNTNKYYSSDLRIDYDKNVGTNLNSWNRVLPRNIETIEANIPSPSNLISPDPASDLDLVFDYAVGDTPNDKFIVSIDDSGAPQPVGAFFNPTTAPGVNEQVTLILERRLNLQQTPPTAQAAADNDNPWIAVDQMVIEVAAIPVKTLALDFADNSNDDENRLRFTGGTSGNGILRDLISRERKDPLNSTNGGELDSTAGAGGTASALDFSPSSTFGATNSVSPSMFQIWQPHFDRELTSAYELMSIPLYGPPASESLTFDANGAALTTGTPSPAQLLHGLTPYRLLDSQDTTKTPFSVANALSDPTAATYHGTELVAANKFRNPDYKGDAVPGPEDPKFDNRWYRLLDLVDVSTQSNHLVQWDQNSNGIDGTQWENTDLPPRLPGAVNLNTIRHRGVLSGLLDDPDLTSHFGQFDFSSAPLLTDTFEANRNWWRQFILSRDQKDPVLSLLLGTDIFLPGLPGSHPYRNGGFVDQSLLSHHQTLLRDVVTDGTFTATDGRNLFEARTSGAATEVDYHTRHRLLRKIANNSTNRSNVFIVWMTVGFFEAVDDSASGSVRIGAQLTTLPEHRGFFIVDRTLLEEAEIEDSANGVRFDYKKFILYRKTLK